MLTFRRNQFFNFKLKSIMIKLNSFKHYLKSAFYLNVMILCLGLVGTSTAQSFVNFHFDGGNGNLGPFETSGGNQNRMTWTSGRLECTWNENDFTGSGTDSKKTEFRSKDNAYQFKQEFWTGYWFNIHNETFQNNTVATEMSLMQIWGFRPDAANWYAMLIYKTDGNLYFRTRYQMGSSNTQDHLIQSNISKNAFHTIVIRVKLRAATQGIVQIWLDGNQKVNKSNVTIGFGDQDSNGQMDGSYSTPGSWGLYNFDNPNYLNNETRTVTYDGVSLWNGASGYSIVEPSNNMSNRVVTFTKSNSTSYAVDGNSNNNSTTKVWLYNYSSGNNNQKWIENRHADGYYSYKKNNNSNMCMDCGASGEKCHLYACSSSNNNQLFFKEYVSDETNYVRLKKKSGGKYLDGGTGGANFTQLKVYDDQSSTQHYGNQEWIISDRGHGSYRAEDEKEFFDYLGTPEDSELKIYPNPAMEKLTISLSGIEFNHYEFFDLAGKLVKKAKVDPTTELAINVNDLEKGQYLLRISDGKEYFQTYKIIKE